MSIIHGKVWKFGNDIDTDIITPARLLSGPLEELKKHVLATINPRFPREIKPGDIIVAGNNFGCGSSRESAASILKSMELGAVIAESFARTFFRNAIAIGLPIAICLGVPEHFSEGDELELDILNDKITNLTTGHTLIVQPLPREMKDVLAKGGIVPILKEFARSGSLKKVL